MKCHECGEPLIEVHETTAENQEMTSEEVYYCPHCETIYKWVKAPVGVDEEDEWEEEQ